LTADLADGAAFDPASGDWTLMPESPLRARREAVSVWSGREMVVWGGHEAAFAERQQGFADGASYDPVSRRWRRFGDDSLTARFTRGLWTSKGFFLWGGWSMDDSPSDLADGAILSVGSS
ncbi:MAG TPA: hypothetical protein VM841_05385, partial [Actinomycetota bacterium]|nr:hypothetical protein [Actinomycetota bacterium]